MDTHELTVIAPDGMVAGGDQAGESYRYYNLASHRFVDITDSQAGESSSWHIAFKRSFIKVNGGPAGPGNVVGGCIAPPAQGGKEEFLRFTDVDWNARFNKVGNIPESADLKPEGVEPAIFGWRVLRDGVYKAPVSKGWKIRCADGAGFAKMRVIDIAEDGESVTILYAYQPAKKTGLMPEKTTIIRPGEAFGFREGVCVDPDKSGWDIKHGADKIYLNSSVSGPGLAGAIGSKKFGPLWGSIDNPSDSIAFFMDDYGSLLRSPKWYRYNLDGAHNLHVNGAVYGLRTNEGDFKVQVFDYFEHKGRDLGNFRIRYKKL